MDSNLIGALELGDQLESYGDGVLEAATAGPMPTGIGLPGCTAFPTQAGCTRSGVSDGALEAVGANVGPGGLTVIALATNCCNFPH